MQVVRGLLVLAGLIVAIGGIYLIAIDLGGAANLPGFEVFGFKFEAGKMPTGVIAAIVGVALIVVAGKFFKKTVTVVETIEETRTGPDGIVENIKKVVETTIQTLHR